LEPISAVNKFTIDNFVKLLVCVGRLQSAFIGEIRAEFNIIEVADIHWLVVSAGIPCDFKVQDFFDIMGNLLHFIFGGVTTHDTHTGDVAFVNLNESIQFIFSEFLANIFPKMRAMAVGAVIRTIGKIYCQTHFIRDLLKNDVIVVVLQHFQL
jgi:hypothetical protein